MFLIKNLRVYTIGKSSAVFSLRGPLCATFPYKSIITKKIMQYKRWESENNFSTLHRKFKAVYSEPPHNVPFGACDDPTTATKLGLYGLHLKLRNKIAMHMFIA